MRRASASSFLFLVCLVLSSGAASAQTTDLIGVRAQGMAGAFTAVADDAAATWWNPAGLAGGAYFNVIIESDRPRLPPGDALGGISVAFPALGLSYYRLPLSQIRPATSTDVVDASRQDEGVLGVYGATVGQSIGNHLVIGSTVKLLRANETKAGLDVGVMAAAGRARLGVMVRNAREVEFHSGTPDAWTLKRHVRAGAAYTSAAHGVIGAATLAIDADVTKAVTNLGEERRLAVGGEVWTRTRALGLRGGVSRSTLGDRNTLLSGGVTAAIRSSTFLDAHITGGDSIIDRRVWGVALRVTF